MKEYITSASCTHNELKKMETKQCVMGSGGKKGKNEGSANYPLLLSVGGDDDDETDIILTFELMSNEMASSSTTSHCGVAFDHAENIVKPAWPVAPLVTLSYVSSPSTVYHIIQL